MMSGGFQKKLFVLNFIDSQQSESGCCVSSIFPEGRKKVQFSKLTKNIFAGISPEAILKGGYPGSGLVSHPSHDLLLERERQIAQERDRNLR